MFFKMLILGFPVFPLTWKESVGYRESGFFPEAVLNFLALLGWNPGTEQELFSKEALIAAFDLSRVQKSGARFDPEKNNWYNHQYLQQKPVSDLVGLFRPVLSGQGVDESSFSDAHLGKAIALIRDRASFVHELWDLGSYLFLAPESYDAKSARKQWKSETPARMKELASVLGSLQDFGAASAETTVKEWLTASGLSFGQVMPPLRLVLVGAMKGPHLFDIMELLGKEETLNRIDRAIQTLGTPE